MPGITAKKPAQRVRGSAIVLLMLIGLAGAACSNGNALDRQADQSFLTDQPCAAPCWQGLELGASTKGAALSLLPTLPFIDAGTVAERGTTWEGDATARVVSFGCVHPPANNCGSAIFSGDRLRWLNLTVNYVLTTRMVVDKIGAPNHLDFGPGDAQQCSVTSAWPMKHIGVMFERLPDSVCQALRLGQGLPADLKAVSMVYTDAPTLQAGPASCCRRVAWPGFTNP